jgi:hypothetical protein
MRVFILPSLFAYTLSGCKDSSKPVNTGDVGVDFLIDASNDQFMQGNPPTELREKYYNGLAGRECVTKLTNAQEKLLKSEELKKLLNPEHKAEWDKLLQMKPDVREADFKQVAVLLCAEIDSW